MTRRTKGKLLVYGGYGLVLVAASPLQVVPYLLVILGVVLVAAGIAAL